MTPAYITVVGRKVVVYDIEDAEAFVRSIVHRKVKIRAMDPSEREELHAEGMLQLLRLAERFIPRKPGYDKDGSFAGYASIYLPKKITSAWHRMHPEHVQYVIDGKKQYVYGEAPASLNERMEGKIDDGKLRFPGDFVH